MRHRSPTDLAPTDAKGVHGTVDMTLGHQQWREEVIDFLDRELPEDQAFDPEFCEDEARWDFALSFTRKVGARGWLGMTWPKEYGGLGMSLTERFIFFEEMNRREAPLVNMIGWGLAAGTLLVGGSHEQKLRFLPPVARMDTFWAEGLSEPGAGSDLASLRTTARLDGDSWVINGQKTYTTWGSRADVLFLAARTDPDAPRHRGISIFCLPLDLPGIQMSPLWNIAGGRQNHFYFDDVRISQDMLIGEVNQAWRYIMNAFYASGSLYLPHAQYERKMRLLTNYCATKLRGGRVLLDHQNIRDQLAELATIIETERVLAYARLSAAEHGETTSSDGTLQAVVAKENRLRFAQIANDIVGPLAQLEVGSAAAPIAGEMPAWFLTSFGNHAGGTSQVKRMQLATRGLGLPR
jgi:alkylation response protein AidB-like acyl-CoA dehydrogenase